MIKKCNLCAGSPNIPLYEINMTGKTIKVDKCIGEEIEALIKNKVTTYGCCCGHGEENPNCLVDISSKDVLNKLGYVLEEYSAMHTQQGIYKIILKTGI